MRKFASVAVAAVGVAGVLLSAPFANAGDVQGSIGLDPTSGKPGDSVTVFGKCTAPGYKGEPLQSGGALDPVTLYLKDKSGEARPTDIWEFTKVAKNAKPGKYTVSYMCGPYKQHMTFTVLPADGKPTAKPAPTTTTTKKPAAPQVKVKPKGAADTGDGSVAG